MLQLIEWSLLAGREPPLRDRASFALLLSP
jgi:hypothetical protein